jgi:hypothetical protein
MRLCGYRNGWMGDVFTDNAKSVKGIKGRQCLVMLINVMFRLEGGVVFEIWRYRVAGNERGVVF